jgi:hypothetical protein
MKSTWIHRIAVILAGAACMAPGCENDALNDSAFKLWCGPNADQLCDWRVDQGHVNKVPTWNEHEFGVELADKGTQISQVSTEGSGCMEFSAVADVDAAADVIIAIDFDLDGTEDYTSQVGETHWHIARTLVYAPLGYGANFRFIVRKRGEGKATLAEIRLQRTTTCSGPRVDVRGTFLVGDPCADDAECASGICCGRAPDGGLPILGACSQCCGALCTDGSVCKPRANLTPIPFAAAPALCDPQNHHGAKNDPCFDDTDCQSGCEGAVEVKNPVCADAGDAGKCATVEVHAGRCR